MQKTPAENKNDVVAATDVIVADLQDFFKKDQTRSTVGRLREMFDTIEKLREGGMSLENIRLVLEKNNLKIGLPTLTKSLQRIRAERLQEIQPTRFDSAANLNDTQTHKKKTEAKKTKQPNTMATSVELNEKKPMMPTDEKIEAVGIVDIFTMQAEREAKKESDAKFKKIPRR